jgi:hypothetical protein
MVVTIGTIEESLMNQQRVSPMLLKYVHPAALTLAVGSFALSLVPAGAAHAELWKCRVKGSASPYYTETPSSTDDVQCEPASTIRFTKSERVKTVAPAAARSSSAAPPRAKNDKGSKKQDEKKSAKAKDEEKAKRQKEFDAGFGGGKKGGKKGKKK